MSTRDRLTRLWSFKNLDSPAAATTGRQVRPRDVIPAPWVAHSGTSSCKYLLPLLNIGRENGVNRKEAMTSLSRIRAREHQSGAVTPHRASRRNPLDPPNMKRPVPGGTPAASTRLIHRTAWPLSPVRPARDAFPFPRLPGRSDARPGEPRLSSSYTRLNDGPAVVTRRPLQASLPEVLR